jgi:hypothetical protein
MTQQTAMVISACVASASAIIAALISKFDLLLSFRKTKFDLSGKWYGMSVYLPVDIYNVGSEAVYKFSAELRQSGARLKFEETIEEFYDIDMSKIDKHPIRVVRGSGKMLSNKDVILHFDEKDSLTCGTMYLTLDTWGKEMQGIISVRNPYFGTPAGVKIVLRRIGEKPVTIEDLGLARIRAMADAFRAEQKRVTVPS